MEGSLPRMYYPTFFWGWIKDAGLQAQHKVNEFFDVSVSHTG